MYRPLADEIRPKSLDDMIGQEHILGENGLLTRIVNSGKIPNMIFYGPSGTGKTTAASIIAGKTNRTLRKINATTSGISEIKEVISEVNTFLAPGGILLYLDEIQYFNKKQQQALLEFIEDGSITLIASTTENPYFCVFNAILSRSTIFEFKSINPDQIAIAVRRAIDYLEQRDNIVVTASDDTIKYISSSCGGDARKAMNTLELLVSACTDINGKCIINNDDVKLIAQRSAMRYDRDGDNHFDIISALMKSIRGSDPDAALHYLARILETGDMLPACRRILCSASEDIGLAYPLAVPIVKACVDSALQLGLPEARLPLAEAVVFLATCPKSNSSYLGIANAISDIKKGLLGDIPRELQNVHADGAGFEREQGYLYPHDYPGHWVKQQYLPDIIKTAKYYEYGDNKIEQAAKAYWELIKK